MCFNLQSYKNGDEKICDLSFYLYFNGGVKYENANNKIPNNDPASLSF